MNEPTNNAAPRPTAIPLSERVRSLRLPETHEASSPRLGWLPWVICGVLTLVAALFALEALSPIDDDLLKKLAEERGLNVNKETSASGSLVKLGVPASSGSSVEISLESKGYIVPISLIQVSPKISGTVMKLNFKEGDEVKKDVVLAELEVVEYKADYVRSKGGVNAAQGRLDELRSYRGDEILQAKADVDDAVAQRDQALARFARTKRLRENNAVSAEDYEAAQSSYISTESRVRRLQSVHELLIKGPRDKKIASATAEVSQAKADRDKAKWRYDNTRVKAPIEGVILSKKTEEGNIVNPSAFSNGLSASLCEMADLYKMEVDLSIAERDIAKVFDAQECRIRAEAFPNRIYKGYVSRIMPMADRSKASVPVRVRIQFPAVDEKGAALPLEKQGAFLRPEMGAIVTFLNRTAKIPDPK